MERLAPLVELERPQVRGHRARVIAAHRQADREIRGAVEVVGGNEDEINLIEAIVAFTERFAVALENMRLIEEAQAASAQEQRISAVVSRFQKTDKTSAGKFPLAAIANANPTM